MFSALSQIAKHSVDLAEMVVEAEIFPAVLNCLKGIRMKYCFKDQTVISILLKLLFLSLFTDSDEYVCKNVATLIREIAKHTPEVSLICLN